MSAPRFLLETLPAAGEVAWLDRDEARHAVGSRRLAEGDAVDLVDGRGGVAQARLGGDRDRVGNLAAHVLQVQRVERARPALHVATAVPKGDRLGTLLDGLGQLAVQSVTPLDCERSVTPADRLSGERPVRILAEAMKQSRGAWLTEVRHPATPEAFAAAAVAAGQAVFMLDPRGTALVPAVAGAGAIALLVGPEGGFGEHEMRALAAVGARPASLGATVLRIELAAVAACAAIRAMG
jgi:16S rRNA (uracil1498-N3)-methyltransferase